VKRASLRPSRWPHVGDVVLWLATGLATLLGILAVTLIDVIKNGTARLRLGFLTKAPTDSMTAGGIFPAIFGTVALVLLRTVAALPAGVATAIYLHAYARPRSHG
jgi:phosphate transport system permease protein